MCLWMFTRERYLSVYKLIPKTRERNKDLTVAETTGNVVFVPKQPYYCGRGGRISCGLTTTHANRANSIKTELIVPRLSLQRNSTYEINKLTECHVKGYDHSFGAVICWEYLPFLEVVFDKMMSLDSASLRFS